MYLVNVLGGRSRGSFLNGKQSLLLFPTVGRHLSVSNFFLSRALWFPKKTHLWAIAPKIQTFSMMVMY